jgi:hypothetical protein
MAWKTAEPTLHADDAIWGSSPDHEGRFLTPTLGRLPLKIWIFVASNTNNFILRLDILRAYDASVGIGHQMLHPAEEELSLRNPGNRAPTFQAGCGQWPGDTCTMRWSSDGSIGEPPRSEKLPGRTEFRDQPSEEHYIDRTLVRDSQEVTVRFLNNTNRYQKLMKESPWHPVSESRWWPHLMWKITVQGTTPTFQNTIVTAKSNLSGVESRVLEELLA